MSIVTFDYEIRKAILGEESYFSELAIRSKAYWGYANEFLEACRPYIKTDREYIGNWPVHNQDIRQ